VESAKLYPRQCLIANPARPKSLLSTHVVAQEFPNGSPLVLCGFTPDERVEAVYFPWENFELAQTTAAFERYLQAS